MTARRIGILGGTFDPIHFGHIDVGRAAQTALGLTRMFVITGNIPPHRPQPCASSYHRFAMVSLAVAGLEGWRASDLELRAGAQSFTTSTLKQFHERGYPSSELFFVLGADAFLEIGNWRDYPAILDHTHFVVVSRPRFSVDALATGLPALAARMARPPLDPIDQVTPLIWLLDAQTADVSSTAIRRHRAQGISIAGLTPPAVQQHIEQHGLYTATVPGRRSLDEQSPFAAGRLHGQE